MESIYYVVSWACHRTCDHCYEDRFRPYVHGALESVIAQVENNIESIINNFPEKMTYLDLENPLPDGQLIEKTGRVVLSGGEALLKGVRDRITLPVMRHLKARYADKGGVKLIVQTTGDLLNDELLVQLLDAGADVISIAGIDDFHVGMEGEERQKKAIDRLIKLFETHGMISTEEATHEQKWHEDRGWLESTQPQYHFFGATPESWIGKLWPRGRAWSNGLSQATIADNFCDRWAGAKNFLRYNYSGSEVSIDPNGDVFPCCLKTKTPIGNLVEEKLIDILDSLVGDPAFEALAMGHPERMGISDSWDVETFIKKSSTLTPTGKPYQNLCIGCDTFHQEVLSERIEAITRKRKLNASPNLIAIGKS